MPPAASGNEEHPATRAGQIRGRNIPYQAEEVVGGEAGGHVALPPPPVTWVAWRSSPRFLIPFRLMRHVLISARHCRRASVLSTACPHQETVPVRHVP